MANIYELTNDFLALKDLIEDGEADEQTLLDTMEAINLELEDKADGYIKVIKSLESDVEGIKKEEPRQNNVLTYASNQLEQQNKVLKLLPPTVDEVEEEPELYRIEVTEKLSAGTGYSYAEYNEKDYVYTDRDNLKRFDVASYITGDSMEPKYHSGEVALIQMGYDSVQGAIYAVDYDGEAYIKKVYVNENNIILKSLNDKYKDIIIPLPLDEGVHFNIVGKVVDTFVPINI